jgi:hypothetical protein
MIADGIPHAALLQGGACQADRPLQRTLGDDHARPQGVGQFLLAHDPVLMVDEVQQQIEHPRLQGHLAPVELEGRDAVDVWRHLDCRTVSVGSTRRQ